jgi:hypothetical protein
MLPLLCWGFEHDFQALLTKSIAVEPAKKAVLLTYLLTNVKFDNELANEHQREALQMIFSGKADGFMANFAKLKGDVHGSSFAPIKFKVADNLAYRSAKILGKVIAKAEALAGPTTSPGMRIQLLFNAQGNERGPGTVAHAWATAVQDDVNTSELRFEWKRERASRASTSRLTGAARESFFAE